MPNDIEATKSRIIETLATWGDVPFDEQLEAFGPDVWNVPKYVEQRRAELADCQLCELSELWN